MNWCTPRYPPWPLTHTYAQRHAFHTYTHTHTHKLHGISQYFVITTRGQWGQLWTSERWATTTLDWLFITWMRVKGVSGTRNFAYIFIRNTDQYTFAWEPRTTNWNWNGTRNQIGKNGTDQAPSWPPFRVSGKYVHFQDSLLNVLRLFWILDYGFENHYNTFFLSHDFWQHS